MTYKKKEEEKMEYDQNKEEEKGRQKKMEDEPINQNQPNWL